jgi:predicted ATPase
VSLLAPMMPEIRHFCQPGLVTPGATAQGSQRLLSAAYVSLFNALASPDKRIVLMLDDCQWADDASLDLLEHCLTTRTLFNTVVLIAFRTAPPFEKPRCDG